MSAAPRVPTLHQCVPFQGALHRTGLTQCHPAVQGHDLAQKIALQSLLVPLLCSFKLDQGVVSTM